MPRKYTKKDFAPQIEGSNVPLCEVEGCIQDGVYKAPKSKTDMDSHRWLCLDHIREHNVRWDFFDGMERDEIETFMKDAVTGHRPTWGNASQNHLNTDKLHHALNDFMQMDKKPKQKLPPDVPAKVRNALSELNLEYPYTVKNLKSYYRKLVKQHHPDKHQGNKKSEETFKRISEAYHCLLEHAKNSG